MKVVICGSMSFSPEMLNVSLRLKELGHEVILPKFTEYYAKLDSRERMHGESIENKLAGDLIKDYYFEIKKGEGVLACNYTKNNIENYIGGNTLIEMSFAHVLEKKLFLLNEIPNMSYSDEIISMRPIILNDDLTKLF